MKPFKKPMVVRPCSFCNKEVPIAIINENESACICLHCIGWALKTIGAHINETDNIAK